MSVPKKITEEEKLGLFALGREAERCALELQAANLAISRHMAELRAKYEVGAGWKVDTDGVWGPPLSG